MVIFGLSASELVSEYGGYAGLAAIPGLAVLALLYFTQAREVKRLREWAARAPDRDRELLSTLAQRTGPRPAAAAAQGMRPGAAAAVPPGRRTTSRARPRIRLATARRSMPPCRPPPLRPPLRPPGPRRRRTASRRPMR